MKEIDWSRHKLWTADMIIAERAALDRSESRWGRAIELEVRRRITVSVAAYAYEIMNDSIISDFAFDTLAEQINPKLGTCHPDLDIFFLTQFSPMTGMWIRQHPELEGIERIYNRHHARRKK